MCLTWFPNWFVYENPINNTNRFVLQECGDFTWMVSNCEELVVPSFAASMHKCDYLLYVLNGGARFTPWGAD